MLLHTSIGEGCSAAVWQVETRKRMQAEYERKMTAMRADTARKQADEAKRLQQRSAAISRLHTATEVQPGPVLEYICCAFNFSANIIIHEWLTCMQSQAAKERIEASRQQHPTVTPLASAIPSKLVSLVKTKQN